MGCDSLVDMQAVEVLGSGYTKLVVRVNLAGGQPAALKLVNENGIDMSKCVEDFRDPQGCRELVSYKLKKELVLLQRLQHPNVIKLMGHCAGEAETGRAAVHLTHDTDGLCGVGLLHHLEEQKSCEEPSLPKQTADLRQTG